MTPGAATLWNCLCVAANFRELTRAAQETDFHHSSFSSRSPWPRIESWLLNAEGEGSTFLREAARATLADERAALEAAGAALAQERVTLEAAFAEQRAALEACRVLNRKFFRRFFRICTFFRARFSEISEKS